MEQLLVCLIFVVILVAGTYFSIQPRNNEKKLKSTNATTTTTPKKSTPKKSKKVCPFSKDSNFVVEVADNVGPSPLDLFEHWIDDTLMKEDEETKNDTKPLAARWLNAGLSGQDTPATQTMNKTNCSMTSMPDTYLSLLIFSIMFSFLTSSQSINFAHLGILRAGLKRLRDSKYFLVQDRHRIAYELSLKKKALDDPKRLPFVYVAEPDSLDAQRECLELFIDYLPRRYPEFYSFDKEANAITVKPIDTTFQVEDFWDTKPLELCERIVQEDLILMRPDNTVSDAIKPYKMAAASVVFSFNELQEKLGKPAEFIHAPVPGFMTHLRKTLNMTFSKLKPEKPLWRNNWGIAPTGTLDEPLYGSTDAHKDRTFADITVDEVKAKFLKVEYQTIRRLPKSDYLLFTVKTMADPMSSLESVPKAAACLAASIRGMSTNMRKYKGIEDDKTCEAVLSYLDSIQE